jgi:hypothetical protein
VATNPRQAGRNDPLAHGRLNAVRAFTVCRLRVRGSRPQSKAPRLQKPAVGLIGDPSSPCRACLFGETTIMSHGRPLRRFVAPGLHNVP